MNHKPLSVAVKSTIITKDPGLIYMRLMSMNVKKCVSLYRLMSFENTQCSMAFFHANGAMREPTSKSDYLQKLETLIPCAVVECPADITVRIFDGHYVIKKRYPPAIVAYTYNEMANDFMMHILQYPAHNIYICFDQYWKLSIKSSTRIYRTGGLNSSPAHHITPNGRIPSNWVDFLLRDVSIAEDFACNHEEADTRMIFHAAKGTVKTDKVLLHVRDTDVAVLAIHHRERIPAGEVFFETGAKGKRQKVDTTRYIPIHEIHKHLPLTLKSILMEAYVLTGADTCSSLSNIGKRKVPDFKKSC